MSAETCPVCSSSRVRVVHPKLYPYRLSGLDNVYLRGGVTRYECGECGEGSTQIDQEQQLMEMIALGLLLKPAMLSGQEMRFLRKASRLSQEALAKRLGLTRRALIEREKKHRPGLRADQELGLRAILFAAFRSRLEKEGSHLHASQSKQLDDALRRFIEFAGVLTARAKIRRTTLTRDRKENRWRFVNTPLAA